MKYIYNYLMGGGSTMQTSELPVLTIEIKNEKPVELLDLTNSLLSFAE